MLELFGFQVSKALLKSLAVPALIVAVFGGGWFSGGRWEHRGPQTFPLAIFGDSLRVQRDKAIAQIPAARRAGHEAGVAAQAAVDRPAFTRFQKRIDQCEVSRRSERDTAAAAVSRAEALLSDQAASAYRLGLAACEVHNAPSPSDRGGPVAGVVQHDPASDGGSFADYLAAGAYRPAHGLPGGGGR